MLTESQTELICRALLGLWVLGFLLSIGFRVVKRARRRLLFPDREDVTILFEERWTSGNSHKSFRTRIGGAANCLRVTVTDSELWVKPHFPFSVLADSIDLEHRISKDNITIVAPRITPFGFLSGRRTVAVEFPRGEGKVGHIELHLRRPDEFLGALDVKGIGDAAS